MVEDSVRSQNQQMGDLSVKFVFFKKKIKFQSLLIKSNHRVLSNTYVDTYGAPVLHLNVALLL